MKEYSKALEYFQKSLDKSSADIELPYIYNNIGACYAGKQDFDEAVKYFNLALSSKHLGKNHYLPAQILSNLGEVYQDNLDYDKSLVYYKKAESIQHQSHLVTLEMLKGKAKTLLLLGNIEASLEIIKKADRMISELRDKLTPEDAIFFSKKVHELNLFALSVCLELKDYKSLFYFSERDKANALAESLEANSKSLPEIQQSLTEDQALIEYAFLDSTEHNLAVFYITQEEFQTKFIKADRVTGVLTKYMEVLTSKDEPFNEKYLLSLGQKLYQFLLEPVQPDKKELIIVPDGMLFQLPFEAISVDAKNYLITAHLFSYGPSAAIAFRDHSGEEEYDYEYIGFAPKFTDLPYSVKEVQHSAQFFNWFYRKTYVNDNATLDNFRSIKSSRVLHISTHSTTIDVIDIQTKKQKGLVFDQNRVLFKEIMPRNIHTDLTMLSACGGVGDIKYVPGEGYQSLMYIFLPKANYIIYPVYRIPDIGAYNLAGLFFTYLEKGLSYKYALHQAKLELIPLEGFSPYYWSGLIITE